MAFRNFGNGHTEIGKGKIHNSRIATAEQWYQSGVIDCNCALYSSHILSNTMDEMTRNIWKCDRGTFKNWLGDAQK